MILDSHGAPIHCPFTSELAGGVTVQFPPRVMADVRCHRNSQCTFWVLSCGDRDGVVSFLERFQTALAHLSLAVLWCDSSVCRWSGRRIQLGVVGSEEGGGLLTIVFLCRTACLACGVYTVVSTVLAHAWF